MRRKSNSEGSRRVSVSTDSTSLPSLDESKNQPTRLQSSGAPQPKITTRLSCSTIYSIAIPPLVEHQASASSIHEKEKTQSQDLPSSPANASRTPSISASTCSRSSSTSLARTRPRPSRKPTESILPSNLDRSPAEAWVVPDKVSTSRPANSESPCRSAPQILAGRALENHSADQNPHLNQKRLPLNGDKGLGAVGDEDHTWHYMEYFNVFDQQQGSKYWKHYEDSVFQRTSKANDSQLSKLIRVEIENPSSSESVNAASKYSQTLRDDFTETAIRTRPKSLDFETVLSSKAGHEKPSPFDDYQGLEDMEENASQYSTLPGPTLDDIMGDPTSNAGSVIDHLEGKDDLRLLEEYLDKHEDDPDVSRQALTWVSSDSGNEESLIISTSSSRVGSHRQESEVLPKNASEMDEELGSANNPRVKKRKDKTSVSVIVHEDSPTRVSAPAIRVSPKTDIPKENYEVEGLVSHSGDPRLRTPRNNRRRVIAETPSSSRNTQSSSLNLTSIHGTLFGLSGSGQRR